MYLNENERGNWIETAKGLTGKLGGEIGRKESGGIPEPQQSQDLSGEWSLGSKQ